MHDLDAVNHEPGPRLTDGVIVLRPLTQADAVAHLAGEDDAMARWLGGGRSSLAGVRAAIEHWEHDWRTGGPVRAFGVMEVASGRLVGFAETRLAAPYLEPGQVNISYGIHAGSRGRGLAGRALELVAAYVRGTTDARELVLLIARENAASLRVAAKAGFTARGEVERPEGRLVRFVRTLSS